MIITRDVLVRVLEKVDEADKKRILKAFQSELTDSVILGIKSEEPAVLDRIETIGSFCDVVKESLPKAVEE